MGDRQQPNLPLVLIDRWAQLAVERPWRYAASWTIGIGAANLGLRMLLRPLAGPQHRHGHPHRGPVRAALVLPTTRAGTGQS
jgi:hypothetical protein